MDLFVYGTLMDPDTVREVTGQTFRMTPALLRGYRKIARPDRYPLILPAADAEVEGLLLHAIDDASLGRFDAYEGEGWFYKRIAVTVLVDGEPRPAAVYAGVPEAHELQD